VLGGGRVSKLEDRATLMGKQKGYYRHVGYGGWGCLGPCKKKQLVRKDISE